VYSAAVERKDRLHQRTFMPVKPIAVAPGTSESARYQEPDASMHEVIRVKDILSIYNELRLDKQ